MKKKTNKQKDFICYLKKSTENVYLIVYTCISFEKNKKIKIFVYKHFKCVGCV